MRDVIASIMVYFCFLVGLNDNYGMFYVQLVFVVLKFCGYKVAFFVLIYGKSDSERLFIDLYMFYSAEM